MPSSPSVWTVLSMLEWATDYFEKAKVKSPRLSIEWLLAHVLSVKRLDLYLAYDRPLSKSELSTLRPLVKRRANHEPLQYITGETDFHRAKIIVRPGVLIPRQETEQLVDFILRENSNNSQLHVLDIGTGSGCIPIALKKARPDWSLSALDISEDALKVAAENAALNEVEINFFQDDIISLKHSFSEKHFDIIVSNPPYILPDEKDELDNEVVMYEPKEALFCSSIETMYGAIETFAQSHLSNKGTVYLELHELYADEILELFENRNWNAFLRKDLNEKPRFLIADKN